MEVCITVIVCFILPFVVLIKPIRNMIKEKQSIKIFFKNNVLDVLFFIILIIGSWVRVHNIGKMPNALNVDEASSGYDAFSIMKYGMDRNGNSFPVVLYAWGSGQSILYSLMSIPFIFVGGLTEFTIRIAMALVGVASLYVMYYLIKNIFDNKKVALVAVAFFSICPWHIMKSRWGMECNLFPDLILISVLLLVLGIKKKKYFFQILSFVVLGISAYSYATSYLFLPVFVSGVLIYLVAKKEISIKRAIAYMGIVAVIAIPLIVYLIINTFDLSQFSIFGITIPRMKANRYEEISTIFSGNLYENCVNNLLSLEKLILLQYDEAEWNALPNYGIFYLISIVFFVIGIYVSIKKYNKNIYNQIMNIWMVSSIVVAAFCIININRINIIIIPCIYYIVLGLYEFCKKYKTMIPCIIIVYMLLFVLFMDDYGKQDFNEYYTFTSGVEEVSDYCKKFSENNIYCDYCFKEPFIYFMFYSEYDVNTYLDTVDYFSEDGIFDNIKSFGKYKFYIPNDIEKNSLVIVPKDSVFEYGEYINKVSVNQFDIYVY